MCNILYLEQIKHIILRNTGIINEHKLKYYNFLLFESLDPMFRILFRVLIRSHSKKADQI